MTGLAVPEMFATDPTTPRQTPTTAQPLDVDDLVRVYPC